MQHTQSALPPLPSLVNNMHPQQQLKGNIPLSQQPPQTNMVQAQNALNNNDVNQAFSAQAMNQGLTLGGLLGRILVQTNPKQRFSVTPSL